MQHFRSSCSVCDFKYFFSNDMGIHNESPYITNKMINFAKITINYLNFTTAQCEIHNSY